MMLVQKVVKGKVIWEEDSCIREVVCTQCRRLIRYPYSCEAFRGDGEDSIDEKGRRKPAIPAIVRNGYSDHSLPIPGDGGLLYEYVNKGREDND